MLKFLCGDSVAHAVRDEIENLAAEHSSEVVRWKAARTLAALNSTPVVPADNSTAPVRWTRLDAAVLSGVPIDWMRDRQRILFCARVYNPEDRLIWLHVVVEYVDPERAGLITAYLPDLTERVPA